MFRIRFNNIIQQIKVLLRHKIPSKHNVIKGTVHPWLAIPSPLLVSVAAWKDERQTGVSWNKSDLLRKGRKEKRDGSTEIICMWNIKRKNIWRNRSKERLLCWKTTNIMGRERVKTRYVSLRFRINLFGWRGYDFLYPSLHKREQFTSRTKTNFLNVKVETVWRHVSTWRARARVCQYFYGSIRVVRINC
jgi:hypothetical protein